MSPVYTDALEIRNQSEVYDYYGVPEQAISYQGQIEGGRYIYSGLSGCYNSFSSRNDTLSSKKEIVRFPNFVCAPRLRVSRLTILSRCFH